MTIKSLNISLPFEIEYNGRTVKTGIYKRPVAERLNLEKLNIKGDGQADLSVHGGEFKAVYSYAREHYAYWQTELDRVLDWGMFGENLTTEGLDESQVFLGNHKVIRRTLGYRTPLLDPINVIQVELLRRLRAGERNRHLRRALMISINGIAAGMQNTG